MPPGYKRKGAEGLLFCEGVRRMAGFLGRLFRKKEREEIVCTAVVPAAGSSSRMEGQDKLLLPLGDMPVLLHTLRALDACPLIHEIIVVTRGDLVVPVGELCREGAFSKVTKVVVGGATRTESVLCGIREARQDAGLIAIHDGARPLVDRQVLEEVLLRAAQCGAAAPAVPVKDTIKRARDGVIAGTPDRAELYAVQTPQVFEASLIKGALEKALADGEALTDDCAAVERLGVPVALTRGSYGNIKITTPEDLAVAEALMDWRDAQ